MKLEDFGDKNSQDTAISSLRSMRSEEYVLQAVCEFHCYCNLRDLNQLRSSGKNSILTVTISTTYYSRRAYPINLSFYKLNQETCVDFVNYRSN